ncbi:MAG: dockerin type I repeat-containing protein [Ruminococcus sp.]|nr:dockerin type I repeat-containing protein [Ruminococcus sp.]
MKKLKKLLALAGISIAVLSLSSCTAFFTSETMQFGSGDLNGDEEETAADMLILQKILLNSFSGRDAKILNCLDFEINRGDLNLDGKVDIFDMVLMRQDLINGNNRPVISTSINALPLTENTGSLTDDEIIFSSATELHDFIQPLYSGADIEDTDSEDSPFTYESFFDSTYTDEFFEKNILLIKPIIQHEEYNDIYYDISKVWIEDENIMIDYTYNYDSSDEERNGDYFIDTPILMQVAVPRELSDKKTVWNHGERDWSKFIEYIDEEPTISTSDTFKYTSPDGSQTFYVSQDILQYQDSDCKIKLHFYTMYDGYDTLAELEILTPDTVIPFSENGSNGEIIWSDDSVEFRFTADKEYSYTFDYIDKTVRRQTKTEEYTALKRKGITSVDIIADCAGNLDRHADMYILSDEMYNKPMVEKGFEVLGGRMDCFLDDKISYAEVIFKYDESFINGSEDNIAVYKYSKKDGTATKCDAVVDIENNTVTVENFTQGNYFLVTSAE